MYVYVSLACLMPLEPEEGTESPTTGITDVLHLCVDTGFQILVLLTAEPSFWAPKWQF